MSLEDRARNKKFPRRRVLPPALSEQTSPGAGDRRWHKVPDAKSFDGGDRAGGFHRQGKTGCGYGGGGSAFLKEEGAK